MHTRLANMDGSGKISRAEDEETWSCSCHLACCVASSGGLGGPELLEVGCYLKVQFMSAFSCCSSRVQFANSSSNSTDCREDLSEDVRTC